MKINLVLVLAGSLAASLGLNAWQFYSRGKAGGVAEGQQTVCVSSNDATSASLAQYATALDECVGREQVAADAEKVSAARITSLTASLERATRTREADRQKAYDSDAACAAWARAPMCPAVSDQLRGEADRRSR